MNSLLALCAAVLISSAAVARDTAPAVITPEEWDADIAMRLGEHAYLGGDVQTALQSFSTAASKDPRRVEAHWRVSHCLALLERNGEALAALERARTISPYDARILNTLAVVQMKAGQAKKAIESARAAVRYAPRVADVWDTLGWAYMQVDDRAQARAAFATALRLDHNHTSAQQGLSRSLGH